MSGTARKNIKNIYPLTPLQEGMLFHTLYDPDSLDYFELTHYHITGVLNIAAFEAAWNELVKRHDILRTVFIHKNVPEPLQIVLKERRIDFQFEDIRALSDSEQIKVLERRLDEERANRFDLSKDCLTRVRILQRAPDSFEVIWTYHHILLDGWSLGILQDEFYQIYHALVERRPPALPAPMPFNQYVQWLKRQDVGRSRSFWNSYLSGYNTAAHFAPKREAKDGRYEPFTIEFALDLADTARLLAFAAGQRVTLNTVVQCVWGTILGGLISAKDVVFGATVSGRPPDLPGVERMVGLFINAVPVRIRFAEEITFATLLKNVQREVGESRPHDHFSLADIQAGTKLRQDLFDHILVFENYPLETALAQQHGGAQPAFVIDRFHHTDHTNYPLTVQVMPGASLGFRFIFDQRVLDRSFMERVRLVLEEVVQRILANSEQTSETLLMAPSFAELRRLRGSPAESAPAPSSPTLKPIRIVLAATFTADPLIPYLAGCCRQFGLETDIVLTPYNQVFQQLLDPNSEIRRNDGINLLIIRLEDWLRDVERADAEGAAALEQQLEMLPSLVLQLGSGAENWIPVFPNSQPDLPPAHLALLHRLHERWGAFLSQEKGWRALDLQMVAERYQLGRIFDPQADTAGHIPFTEEFYASAAATIARKVVSWRRPPFKVIAVDCDNTLWQGVCGEDGASGVAIDGGFKALQQHLIKMVEQGFLLALCSKNEEADVWSVFDSNSNMLLQRRHVVASRINWRPKSENLRSLAAELKLGLDSFIFLDDSNIECSEVMANCPEVLSLRLPVSSDAFPLFLEHVWAFDRFAVTGEDRIRTRLYQAEQAREQLRQSEHSLEAFLQGLQIKVAISPVGAAQVPRVAQLTQRTNQFNSSTIRRTNKEVQLFQADVGALCWMIHVSDRFGDYGLTGFVFARAEREALRIDTLALSCRVLGRRVEDAVLCALRREGARRGAKLLYLDYKPTERNGIFREFLQRTGWKANGASGDRTEFSIEVASLPETMNEVSLQVFAEPRQEDEGKIQHSAPAPARPESRMESVALSTEIRWDVLKHEGCPASLSGYYQMLQLATGACLAAALSESSQKNSATTGSHPDQAPENEVQHTMLRLWKAVLDVEEIGIDDNFFDLGGHSLKATRILSRVFQEFGKEIQLRDVFESPTIRALCDRVTRQEAGACEPIPSLPEKPHYDLSHSQRRLWVLDRLVKDSIAYNNSGFYLIEGPLDDACLSEAFFRVVQRHESLRTTFEEIGQAPVQKVRSDSNWKVITLDWRKDDSSEERVRRFALDISRTPFDLSRGPLLLVYLIRLSEVRHALFLHMHHIISDGWSVGVMEQEVWTFYKALKEGRTPSLPPLSFHYKEYAAWHQAQMASAEAAKAREYWLRQLSGPIGSIDLPLDAARPPVQSFNGANYEFVMDPATWRDLRDVGAAGRATPFVVLATLVKILLFRYSRQEDIVIGSPVSGRTHPDLENQIGFYVNTLPLRDRVRAGQSFEELLREMRRTVADAYEHQIYPFDLMVQDLKLPRDLSRSPLFDVMVLFESALDETSSVDGLAVRPIVVDACISRFDLVFSFVEKATGLSATITYNSDLFHASRIERMAGHLNRLAHSVAAHPASPLSRLEMLSLAEKKTLLETFNHSDRAFEPRTIVDLFGEQVRRTPLNIAVIGSQGAWSYEELDQKSDHLANYLETEIGIQNEEIVSVMVEDGQWAIVALLAIMKARGVYLPIDSRNPAARVRHILSDSGCRVVLTDSEWPGISSSGELRWCRLDQLDPVERCGAGRPRACPLPRSLAYVIYTSGSTGKPKGVLVEHAGFVNMIEQQIALLAVTDADRVIQFASLSFDASLSEIFMALLAGAALYLPPKAALKDPDAFCDYLEKNGVTVATLPPVFLNALEKRPLKTLRKLITAGEAANPGEARYYAGRLRYFNGYGPTEASVCMSMFEVLPESPLVKVPIGKPLRNLNVYVVDPELNLVPIGVPGEIAVSGIGLARAYLNQPELTAAKFVDNPFVPGERLYRTGDLGRWRNDGNLEFIGRIDGQVKIRGHRIELDEIRFHLCRHSGVREAAVVPTIGQDGAAAHLVAYIVASAPMDAAQLRSFLSESLPEYGIPSRYCFVERLPLNASGKVDTALLPKIENLNDGEEPSKAVPASVQERDVIEAWKAILGRGDIGIHDGFFDLGGDSITAIQAVSRLRQKGWAIEIKDIYLHSTAERLAARLQRSDSLGSNTGEAEVVTGPVEMTAIQQWFFQDYPGPRHHFNHSEMLYARDGIDEEIVAKVFRGIQAHHDALRMRFDFNSDGTVATQFNAGVEHPFYFEVVDLRHTESPPEALERHASRAQRSLDLRVGPLMKIVLYRGHDGDRLLVIIHHLVVDAVSWRVILEDFLTGYDHLAGGGILSFPSKTDSFQKWAAAVHRYSQSSALLQEIGYWQAVESVMVKPLPTHSSPHGDRKALSQSDRTPDRDEHLFHRTDHVEIRWTEAQTDKLLNEVCSREGLGLPDILLGVLARCIGEWNEAEQVLIYLEGHGRESIDPGLDVSRTAGWFTAVYPVVLESKRDLTTIALAQRTRAILRNVPNKGFGYGILKYVTPRALTGGFEFKAKPQISFNYLGRYGQELGKGRFEIAKESDGDGAPEEGRIIYDLNFNAIVVEKCLRVVMAYRKQRFAPQSMAALMEQYHWEIVQLVEKQTTSTPGGAEVAG